MTKIEEIKNNFIQETYEDTWKIYEESLNNSNIPNWDWIILTASNDEQAKIYQYEINNRLNKELLSSNTKYAVIPDYNNERIGSGGATLSVLKYVKENIDDSSKIENQKILVIHSGGDSKRIPQYSACGKLFSPVQRELPDGRSSTLFDELIIAFSAIPSRMSPGMLLLSGDILLIFNPLQVDLHYLDSAAISVKTLDSIGRNHGVFLSDKDNNVKKFLHKQSIDVLRKIGASNKTNLVDIDTGAIYLNYEIIKKLLELISTDNKIDIRKFNKFVNNKSRISLYADFVYPLAGDSSFEQYLLETPEGEFCEELTECRKLIWNKLHDFNMRVIKLSPAYFIHFGTTKELLQLVNKDLYKYKCLKWKNIVFSNCENTTKYSVNSSYIYPNAVIGENSYIENSYIGSNTVIGKNTILSNTDIEDIIIPNDVCVNTFKLKNGKFVTRIYSIYDDPKTIKSNQTKFMNTILENMIKKYSINETQIWKSKEKSIWKANLFCCCDTNNESIKSAIELYNILYCNANIQTAKNYFNKDRISLCDSFNMCDFEYTKQKNNSIKLSLITSKFLNSLEDKKPLEITNKIILKNADLEEQVNDILNNMDNLSLSNKYRVYMSLFLLCKDNKIGNYSPKYFENLCYEKLKNSICNIENPVKSAFKTRDEVKVELPIRINFAGTWSDTPPFCNENGGNMVNGAFSLNDNNPIKVTIKKIKDNKIILRSIDLNVKKEFKKVTELQDCNNTNDIFSLPKASLIVSGIVSKEDKNLEQVINRINGGIELITDATLIPKGSGLGTSSILAGACLKALYKYINVEINNNELCHKVLEQEQLMETGGGWQDQVGGLIQGIKYTNTLPGEKQKFNIEILKLNKNLVKTLNSRLILIYTGQRRLAKNLLRDIMNNYISNDIMTVNTINKIKELALECRKSLINNNIQEFAQILNKHWELSKKLDPNCTNTCINQILLSCEDLIDGRMICGAGGGGFLQVLLKENVSKEELDKRLGDVFQDNGIKTYSIKLVEGEI